MKKNKLIDILNKIEGNPDIYLWNGYVGDWMDIGNISESDLVKQTFDYYVESVRLEEAIDKKDFTHTLSKNDIFDLSKSYKKFEYEVDQYVSLEDIQKKRYKKKRVVFIDAKPRVKFSFDRLGYMEY
jgi:hypothetical protein